MNKYYYETLKKDIEKMIKRYEELENETENQILNVYLSLFIYDLKNIQKDLEKILY